MHRIYPGIAGGLLNTGRWIRRVLPIPITAEAATAFDPALMASMNWPWPVIVFSTPDVVASGLTPSDNIPR